MTNVIVAAKERIQRHVEPVPIADIIGLGGVPLEVGMWVLVKREEFDALKAARAWVTQEFGADGLNDDDITRDAKNIEAMFRACRQVAPPHHQLFPGPNWMREQLTTDQVNGLLSAYNAIRSRFGGADWGIDDERVEAIVQSCVRAASTEIPELVLATIPREAIASVVVILSQKYTRARDDAAAGATDLASAFAILRAIDALNPEELATATADRSHGTWCEMLDHAITKRKHDAGEVTVTLPEQMIQAE